MILVSILEGSLSEIIDTLSIAESAPDALNASEVFNNSSRTLNGKWKL
jgi:hypothetical protein